jgi:hypothetical protein
MNVEILVGKLSTCLNKRLKKVNSTVTVRFTKNAGKGIARSLEKQQAQKDHVKRRNYGF